MATLEQRLKLLEQQVTRSRHHEPVCIGFCSAEATRVALLGAGEVLHRGTDEAADAFQARALRAAERLRIGSVLFDVAVGGPRGQLPVINGGAQHGQ